MERENNFCIEKKDATENSRTELTVEDLVFLDNYGDKEYGLGLRHASSKNQFEREIAHGSDRGDALALSSISNLYNRDPKSFIDNPDFLAKCKTYSINPPLNEALKSMTEANKIRLLHIYKDIVHSFINTCSYFSSKDFNEYHGTVRDFIFEKTSSHYFFLLNKLGAHSGRDFDGLGKCGTSPHRAEDIKATITPDEIKLEFEKIASTELDNPINGNDNNQRLLLYNYYFLAFWQVFVKTIGRLKIA